MSRSPILIAAAAASVIGIGCTTSPAEPPVAETSRYRVMQEGLCSSLYHVEDSNIAAAAIDFYDRSHQALHALAAEAVRVDRSAAARLLEAKQAVKAPLESHDHEVAAAGLREVITISNAVLAVLGHPAAPPCDPEEQP